MDSVAAAVAALRKHHNTSRVVLVGHSGGAAPLVDVAVLISCLCNIPIQRDLRGRSAWPNAASLHDYLSKVPKTARPYLLTGENDRNTRPVIARNYAAQAKSLGLNAEFIELPDAGHGLRRISRQPQLNEVLTKAVTGG